MTTLSLIDLDAGPGARPGDGGTSHRRRHADVGANAAPYMAAATAGIRYGDSGGYWPGFLDLGEYLRGLAGVGPTSRLAARDALETALDAAVIDQIGTAVYGSATGLTVYFPRSHEIRQRLRPAADRPAVAAVPRRRSTTPRPRWCVDTDIGFTVEACRSSPPLRVVHDAGAVTANFSGTVQLLAALPDSGQPHLLRDDAGRVDDGQATGVLLPSLTTVSDGTNSAVPFTRYAVDDGSPRLLAVHAATPRRLDRQPQLGPRGRYQHRTVHDRRPDRDDRRLHAAAGDLAYPIVMIQRPGAQPVREATAPALDLDVGRGPSSNSPLPAGQAGVRRTPAARCRRRPRRLPQRLLDGRPVSERSEPAVASCGDGAFPPAACPRYRATGTRGRHDRLRTAADTTTPRERARPLRRRARRAGPHDQPRHHAAAADQRAGRADLRGGSRHRHRDPRRRRRDRLGAVRPRCRRRCVPVVFTIYLYDVNEWDDEPVPVVLATVVVAGLLGAAACVGHPGVAARPGRRRSASTAPASTRSASSCSAWSPRSSPSCSAPSGRCGWPAGPGSTT